MLSGYNFSERVRWVLARARNVKKGKATQTTGPDLPYTSRAKKALELAMSEARELKHGYVGTEHLLLGLLREGEGIAGQVLVDAGLSLGAAREQVLRLLGTGSHDQPLPSTTFGLALGKPVALVVRVRYPAGSVEWSFERKADAISFLESLP
jgi:hypothetical protein